MSDNRAMMLVRQASIDHSSQIEVQIFITPNFNFLWKKTYKNRQQKSVFKIERAAMPQTFSL